MRVGVLHTSLNMKNVDVNKPTVPADSDHRLATDNGQKPYSECQSSNTGKLVFLNSKRKTKECIMYS
jgi:hypothetical protein